jgi:hypothetical protein
LLIAASVHGGVADMKAGLILAVAATLLLGGCYESEDIVFPTEGGDMVPLQLGLYRCTTQNANDTVSYRVTPSSNNAKYIYAIESVGEEKKETTTLTFHRVADDHFVGVTPREEQGKVVPGQGMIAFHWDGKALNTMSIKDELTEQLAKKYGVELRGSPYKIGGPIESQRAFMLEVAVNPSLETVQSCIFVSS